MKERERQILKRLDEIRQEVGKLGEEGNRLVTELIAIRDMEAVTV